MATGTPRQQQSSEFGSNILTCAGVATGVGAGIGRAAGSLTLGVALGGGLLVFMAVALCRAGGGRSNR